MASTVTTNYAGEVLDHVHMLLTTQNELFTKGICNLIPEITKTIYLPKWTATGMIGAYEATPAASIGNDVWTEAALTVGKFMLYHRFSPDNFDQIWKKYSNKGQLEFRFMPPNVQKAFFDLVMNTAQSTIEDALTIGDTGGGSAPLNIIDGIEVQLVASSAVQVATPVALTVGNIESKVRALYDATSSVIRRNRNWKILMNYNTSDLYQDAIAAQANKGNDFTSTGPLTFKGKEIVTLNSISDNTMIAGVFTPGVDSAMHVAMDWNRESLDLGKNVLLVDRLQNDSHEYFVRGDWKMGVGFPAPEQITMYQA